MSISRLLFIAGCLLGLIFPGSSVSQITFERNYGGTEDDIGQCVRQTADGGYIIGGYTRSFGVSDYDGYVIRTDDVGDTLWTRTFGGPGLDRIYALVITPDNGYLLCGSYLDPSKAHSDIWLIRLTDNGDSLWTRHSYSSTNAEGHSVKITPGGGFIVTGVREDAGGTGHLFLMETNASGEEIWVQDYPYWATSGGNAVEPTNDDGFVVCGYIDTYNPSWNRSLGIVKTNSQGDTLWTRLMGGATNEMGWSICESSSGGYLAAGYTTGFGASSGDAYLVKTTDQGVVEWQTHFGKSGLDILYDITNTSDFNYIATGISGEQGSEFQEAWLVKIDPLGDTLWSHSFGGYRKSYGYSVMQTTDEGYIFCGSTNASGSSIYDVMLVKTSSEGLITSLSDPSDASGKLHIYPNPSHGQGFIELPPGSERLVITTLSGQPLLEEDVRNRTTIILDLNGVAPGICIVKVFTHVSTYQGKLVIR